MKPRRSQSKDRGIGSGYGTAFVISQRMSTRIKTLIGHSARRGSRADFAYAKLTSEESRSLKVLKLHMASADRAGTGAWNYLMANAAMAPDRPMISKMHAAL